MWSCAHACVGASYVLHTRCMSFYETVQAMVEEVVDGQTWPVIEHTNPAKPNRTRVVVLGSGWGAISMVKALNSSIRYAAHPVCLWHRDGYAVARHILLTVSVCCSEEYDISLISPRNYFLVRAPAHDRASLRCRTAICKCCVSTH